jgi:hypothetical protein
MSILRKITFSLAALGLLLGAPAAAQQIDARIIGKVVDQSQAALPGVTVTATSKQNGQMRTTVSSEDGGYTVTNLQPGT